MCAISLNKNKVVIMSNRQFKTITSYNRFITVIKLNLKHLIIKITIQIVKFQINIVAIGTENVFLPNWIESLKYSIVFNHAVNNQRGVIKIKII